MGYMNGTGKSPVEMEMVDGEQNESSDKLKNSFSMNRKKSY
jgi:hypothetical protein